MHTITYLAGLFQRVWLSYCHGVACESPSHLRQASAWDGQRLHERARRREVAAQLHQRLEFAHNNIITVRSIAWERTDILAGDSAVINSEAPRYQELKSVLKSSTAELWERRSPGPRRVVHAGAAGFAQAEERELRGLPPRRT